MRILPLMWQRSVRASATRRSSSSAAKRSRRCRRSPLSARIRAGGAKSSRAMSYSYRNESRPLTRNVRVVGAQLGISHRVHDVAVAQEVLPRSGIDAVIGKLEAAGVAQHVRMNGKGKLCQFSGPADHFQEPGPRHRPTAFGVEDEAALQVIPPQLPKGPDLLACERVRAIDPCLARRTWMRPLSSSIMFQVNSQSSLARSPWR